MSIEQQTQRARDQRRAAIDDAIAEGIESCQLPREFTEETDGTVIIQFTWGMLARGRWDHSGERPSYVVDWLVRVRYWA